MLLYGTPSEYDTGSSESHHKPAKFAAQLTQRNEATFMLQTATRMTEFLVLDLALCEINHGKCLWEYFGDLRMYVEEVADTEEYDDFSLDFDDESEAIPELRNLGVPEFLDSDDDMDDEGGMEEDGDVDRQDEPDEEDPEPVFVTGGTRIRVYEDPEDDNKPKFEMMTRSKKLRESTQWDAEVVEFLVELQNLTVEHLPQPDLPIYTLHQRNNHVFHGHPNYRCHGPWNDWALVDWGSGYGVLPTHIWCFVKLEDMPRGGRRIEYGGVYLDDNVYAVVEAAEYDDPEVTTRMTDLFTPLTKEVGKTNRDGEVLERRFYLADVEAIVGPCAVIL